MQPDTAIHTASLTAGASAWSTQGSPDIGLRAITMSDGPHGVRKVESADNLDYSIPATAFPTTACLACAWDRELTEQVGAAIGAECRELGIDTLLGPGLNIKRSPLGGRNFEYYSEDPVVSGELAAAFIRGVQSHRVAATIKHFAANNAEFNRMIIDARIDERALREIYLAGFERAITKGRPWALMTAYNRLNGSFCTENHWLLTTILREEWNFDGLVMSDWTAVTNRPAAIAAGCDLEMPGPSPHNDAALARTLASTDISDPRMQPSGVPRAVAALRRLADRTAKAGTEPDRTGTEATRAGTELGQEMIENHHELARQAAAAGMVLLQNPRRPESAPDGPGILPFEPHDTHSLAIIGTFADSPRYQGSGSSQMNPTRLPTVREAAAQVYPEIDWVPGYDSDGCVSPSSAASAAATAARADAALLLVGLTADHESEGFDRENLNLPDGQADLIRAVCTAQPRTAVAVIAGSVVDMSWRDAAQAIVYAGLAGQGGAQALIDIISGARSPRGRLTESFPMRLQDTPCFLSFPGEDRTARYGESLFVGYRYYESVGLPTAFPFGYGLSYTSFSYSRPALTTVAAPLPRDTVYQVAITVTNSGSRTGTEVVQLYVRPPASRVQRPRRELRNFTAVPLAPGESQRVELEVTARDLCYWNTDSGDFTADPGEYTLELGSSASHIHTEISLDIPRRIGSHRNLDEWDSVGEWLEIPEVDSKLQELLPHGFYTTLKQGTRPTDRMFQNIPLIKMAQFYPERWSPGELLDMITTVARST